MGSAYRRGSDVEIVRDLGIAVFLEKLDGRRQSLLGALPARRVKEAAIRESGE